MENPCAVHLSTRSAYIPVPKVACTSFREAVKAAVTRPAITLMPVERLAEIAGDGWLVWTFVRNPLDRMISFWRNLICKDDTPTYLQRQGFRPWMSFADCVANAAAVGDDVANHHFESQWSILTHEGRLVPDWIGRFERIAEDYETIAARLRARGVEMPRLGHNNPSRHAHWSTYYTPELTAMVHERYANDFAAWYPEV